MNTPPNTHLDSLITQNFPTHVAELKEWLRIPSISTKPEHAADVRAAGAWMQAKLQALGFPHTEMIETDFHPLVYAEWCPHPDKPTVLIYGHFDVQPPEPLEDWHSPPFEPVVKNGKIYARGANDDKGQCMVWFGALTALVQHHGAPPVNIKILLEGEEECGGESIEHYVKTNPKKLACDAVYVCDTSIPAADIPAITVGLRGIIYTELTVQGCTGDQHSGHVGGIAPNPLHALCVLINRLKGEDGKINIPELMAAIPTPPPAETALWQADPLNLNAKYLQDMGVKHFFGDNTLPPLQRVGAMPTLEVHGIKGGFTAEGAKTVIPATASAKISLRLPAGINPDDAYTWYAAAVARHMPQHYAYTLKNHHGGRGVALSAENPTLQVAAASMAEVYGKPPIFTREGGSIPIAALLDETLHVPVVLMGFGLPEDALHAPNENYTLAQLEKGMKTVARFLERLA